jgi:hypothetical protein
MPVGVWNVRENVRSALRKEAKKFSELKEAILFISSLLHIPMKKWIESSELLKSLLMQRRLDEYGNILQKRPD